MSICAATAQRAKVDWLAKTLADEIKYTLGSSWVPISGDSQTLTAFADGGGTLASVTTTPPSAPQVFTAFLMGSSEYKYSVLPQVDAPETGPCKPSVLVM